ncbi:MAG: SRPBCC family protein [Cellvibrionaceae bacterium]
MTHTIKTRISVNLAHLTACLILLVSSFAMAQRPAPPALAVPNPNYVSVYLEIDVNKSATDVWKRVGKYCDIGEWLNIPGGCKMLSGKEGEVGSVRSVANEILVAKTELSYAYTQPVRKGVLYNLYHGNLEARPIDEKTSKLVYTLVYDDSLLENDEARKAQITRLNAIFTRALNNMKKLAEES